MVRWIADMFQKASTAAPQKLSAPKLDKVKAFLYRNAPEIVFATAFLLVTLFIFRNYSLGANVPGSDSMGLPSLIEAAKYNHSFFSPWSTLVGLGYADYPSPVTQSIYFLASSMGIPAVDIAKMVMIVSFWLAGVTMFACMRRLSFGILAALAATAVFCFNQAFLSQITEGHYYYVLGYALFPLIFLIFHHMLKGQEMRRVYLVPAVLLLFGTVAPPNIIVIALIFLGLYSIFFRITNPFPARTWLHISLASGLILVFTGLSIILAAGAQVYGTSYPIQEAFRWSSHSILDGLTLTASENSFFFGNAVGDWVQPASLSSLASVIIYVIPVLAFSSLLFKEGRRETIPLALVSIALMFLAKGPNAPFSGPFTWAFDNIPYFDTIRVFSRFSMFTGFTYGLMISHFIKSLQALPPDLGSLAWARLRVRNIAPVLVAVLVPICLLIPSSVMLSGEVSGYDLPPGYAQPLDWLSEQEGDFRVLYLPNLMNYYNNNRSNGYPVTTTLDPGFYSSIYTQKDVVFGQTSYDAWYSLHRTVLDKKLGHTLVPSILGNTASMRYVAIQTYVDEGQADAYTHLEGLEEVKAFDGGASILEADSWSPRASAYSQLSLVSGGREALTTLAGMRLYQPDAEALVFLDQVDPTTAAQLLDQASHIYVYNGQSMDLMMGLITWSEGQRKDLSSLGASHTTNTSQNWIYSTWPVDAGYTLNPTIYTTGRTTFSVTVDPSASGATELYLKLLKGPGIGKLTIDVQGTPSLVYDPSSADYHMEWVRIPIQNLTGSTTVTISNDGAGANYIEQLLVTSPEEMAKKVEQCRDILGSNIEKLVYVYMGTGYFDSAMHVQGWKGWGVASTDDDGFSIEVGDLLGGQPYLLLENIEYHEANATLNGSDLLTVNTSLPGTLFDLGTVMAGDNITIRTNGMYGVALYSGEFQEASRSEAKITYTRSTSDSYQVSTSSASPIVLQISEGYSSLWEGRTNGSALVHIPINSMVNGYLITPGDHVITVEFQGKTRYSVIIGALVAALVIPTASLWFFSRRSQRRTV